MDGVKWILHNHHFREDMSEQVFSTWIAENNPIANIYFSPVLDLRSITCQHAFAVQLYKEESLRAIQVLQDVLPGSRELINLQWPEQAHLDLRETQVIMNYLY